MHEYSVIQALVGRVESEARSRGATGVHRVCVSIGELSGVDPGLLATAYDTFRAATICANAPLQLRTVEARWECRRCGRTVPRGEALQCADCHSPARMVQGDEIMLDQVELEVP
jgi:hydrogenase nickel incorporation protein HypA/HybF